MTMMMRRILLLLGGCSGLAGAQTHKVAKPESVVRAVGVYEWTGDLAKPAASRLIPVTVFIDGQLQDAGVYLARPVPLALLSGNLYELQDAGKPKGALELSFARHMQMTENATGASLFDDGWFGYGSYKAPAAEKKAPALKPSKQLAEVKGSKGAADDGRPHFSNKGGAADADANANKDRVDPDKTTPGKAGSDKAASDAPVGSATPEDADRPTMRRRSGSSDNDSAGKSSTASTADKGAGTDTSTPADDPDRPHLSKKTSGDPAGDTTASTPDSGSTQSGSGQSGSSQSGSGGDSDSKAPPTTASGGSKDDPDRPTLKRRTAEEIKQDRKKEDRASVTGVGSLNDDPNRPTIHRGKPASALTEDDLPKLTGLPVDLKQMVAVSDAANRPVHEFARPWEDDAERKAILTKMQTLARAKLAGYGAKAAASVPEATPPALRKGTPAATATARRAAAAKKAAASAEVALLDEDLKGYTLSYGGLATYVYSAHTAGVGAALDYVTVVAQADALGELKPALDNVTDAAHLDRTPRMRLVDAVDAEASNRASLLFELRGQHSRQFGLYSVIGARSDQKFLSGSTQ
ncbi:MAG: hypothetical protein JWM43_67 [Acidobacteriaceae bacterium]|nr:hypothetical protein [Acidobacteriaceae bacterium]